MIANGPRKSTAPRKKGDVVMLVEITETCRQTENLNYPCEHLTVGFISEEQLQALARQAGLHLPIPTEMGIPDGATPSASARMPSGACCI